MDDQDTALMVRVAAGDEGAFSTLVERTTPRLIGYFRRLGADSSLAEDCAQETLWKVWRARRGYRPRARFASWLFRIARNHWIDLRRHERLLPRMQSLERPGPPSEAGAPREVAVGGEEPIDRLEQEAMAEAIRTALDTLPLDLREVFVLAQVETLRYQEIAEILQIPVGTVKSRMHAAVQGLRAALRAQGWEP